MNKHIYLAVDLGTSYIKAGAYDLHGNVHASASVPVPDTRPEAGVFIQDGNDLFDSVCRCIKETTHQLLNETLSVSAIAFTGQMAGAIGIDDRGNDVTTWSCSLDMRYLPWAEKQRRLYADEIYAISCTNAPLMCSKYAWFRDTFPEKHKKIAKYVMLPAFLINKLSDANVEDSKIDSSLIAWTGLADLKDGKWSEKLCSDMEIDINLLPKIVPSTEIGGYLNEKNAALLGLPSGIPLVIGAGDKVSGCLGAGITRPGDMAFEASSYGAISCVVPDILLDNADREYDIICGITPRDLYVHKYLPGSGITADWYIREFFGGENGFARADQAALELKPGNGMLAIGLLNGSAMPFDSDIRGAFLGHSYASGKAHFYRALVESFAYDLEITLGSIYRNFPQYRLNPIRLLGGAAHSPLWQRVLADVTGCAFEVVERNDSALLGTMMLAAAGVGELTDIGKATESILPKGSICLPDEKAHLIYQPYVRLYKEAEKQLHPIFSKLNAIGQKEFV